MHYLILGGGSAGCVLAARLSEDTNNRVTLIEAGIDVTRDSMAPHIRSRYAGRAFGDAASLWSELKAFYGAPLGKTEGRTARRYEQARILGGGSSINAMVANRGSPDDYDEWQALGAEGWSWDTVLPYFRKLERDVDFDGPLHGKEGPLPIRRTRPEAVSAFSNAVTATLETYGYKRGLDQNAEWVEGLFVGALAVSDDGERVPTAVAYLIPEVRARSNLTVITEHLAERLIIEDGQATGTVVSPTTGGGARSIAADEVIVSAGAIHTAALLMRSGIGPGDALQALGIPVVANRTGVGRNLMEHPSTAVSTYLPPPMRLHDLMEHHDHRILRWTSSIPDAPVGDMHFAMIARSGWHAIGQRVGTLLIWCNKPFSRGEVTLLSPDPRAEPVVDFRLLSDARDLERLKEGFRLGAKALTDPVMTAQTGPAFPTSYSARVAAIGAPGAVNTFQRGLFAAMLDYAGPLRRSLITNVVTRGITIEHLLADDAALTEFIGTTVGGVWHASGTARMGRAEDPLAVTDAAGRVHDVAALRVCDASLMPSIPRANTNVPAIMIAERVADLIKAGK
jgi:5-(hydroxymethyl)furfural/furfural oxidase